MRRRYLVRGIVQGVNFRNTAVTEARRVGLSGRVWNQDDGAVGCVAEGDAAAIQRFREWLGRGPRSAQVESVEEQELEGEPRYRDFRISPEPAD